MKHDISVSARFEHDYDKLLQKVKERWQGWYAHEVKISESKASRILNKKQFDVLTLLEMAAICGYTGYLGVFD